MNRTEKMVESLWSQRPDIVLEALRRFLKDYDTVIHPKVEAEANGRDN